MIYYIYSPLPNKRISTMKPIIQVKYTYHVLSRGKGKGATNVEFSLDFSYKNCNQPFHLIHPQISKLGKFNFLSLFIIPPPKPPAFITVQKD